MVENISPVDVWHALRTDPDAQMVDVRTDAEWNFVGLADLSEARKTPALPMCLPVMIQRGAQMCARAWLALIC